MIDKNDVKMPVQRDNTEIDPNNPAQVENIQKLLNLVNEVNSTQELRLGEDYYGRFTWFGSAAQRNAKSYFSYQEQAVYDFIFKLNKSGILSDQVGMGKTIEAGMIISELASRSELRSLLIVVPNEIMSVKWQTELHEKFGIVEHKEGYPGVSVIRNYDDFCMSVFKCLRVAKFGRLVNHTYQHKYSESAGDTLAAVIEHFVKEDIAEVVDIINEGFENSDMPERVEFDGKCFSVKGKKDGFELSRSYRYDSAGLIKNLLREARNYNVKTMVNNVSFSKKFYSPIINAELSALYTLVGDYFVTYEKGKGKQKDFSMTDITGNMIKNYPILVVPISYINEEGKSEEFLNRRLLKKVENYKHKYTTWKFDKDGEKELDQEYEEYRVIDFFIDVGYQTLIVDEVHDYIDVSSRMARNRFHADPNIFKQYPSSDYNRYELFDDYYFIKKKSLYKKLKLLADKANRKIFLTATPIKSDMVDFYLLALLASNKDSEAYKRIQDKLKSAYLSNAEREENITNLYQCFVQKVDEAADWFCKYSNSFLALEQAEDGSGAIEGRYKYPYFHNSWLEDNGIPTRKEKIVNYLKGHIYYLTVEEIIMELILAYIADRKEHGEEYTEPDVSETIKEIFRLFGVLSEEDEDYWDYEETDDDRDRRTRVIFRTLFNNSVKIRFEKDFIVPKRIEKRDSKGNAIRENGRLVYETETGPDGKQVFKTEKDASGATVYVPIKRIRELLELEDGPRRWHDTYRKYGIRHTRHQTYNLSECPELSKLSKKKADWYKNLPLWPKRDGKVIFLVRVDVFFDRFLEVRRQRRDAEERCEVQLKDLPNYDKLTGEENVKEERFQSAVSIFDYINDSMSGGSADTHQPHSSKYQSIDMDDAAMVEFKLALVSRLMSGSGQDKTILGEVRNKVLLFAENGKDEILEWFRYQKRAPLYDEKQPLDEKKLEEYKKKWSRYSVGSLESWNVSTDTADLNVSGYDNLLIIIDPKRYEKGVDLQKADTIINFDINYDPLKMEQRIGRIDRIRPRGAGQNINIVSFVPLNDMSGFVINFFANEMKMFTQWMGETTGIVSVPDEENETEKNTGEKVSFDNRVLALEEYYKAIYKLCNSNVSEAEIEKMAKSFGAFFGTDFVRTENDFRFLQRLRPYFDEAFRNSVMPLEGMAVKGHDDLKVVRFNSALKAFAPCTSEKCSSCPDVKSCEVGKGDAVNNSYKKFKKAVTAFFEQGKAFYDEEYVAFLQAGKTVYTQGTENNFSDWLLERQNAFAAAKKAVHLPEDTESSFTMRCDEYWKIFGPMKQLYWDTVVERYLGLILEHFHNQCDNVLEGAKLFERFIKMLSIADFMENMEGPL